MIDELQQLAAEKRKYPVEAYVFLYRALERAQTLVGEHRHVCGSELLEGARLLAVELFGPLALMVFEHWGTTQGEDFGAMVFHLVERGLMGKTDEDKREDFAGVYDFREALSFDEVLGEVKPNLQARLVFDTGRALTTRRY